MKKRKLWAHSVSDQTTGLSVTVHERAPGGVLYERAWDPAGQRTIKGRVYAGAQRRRTLGHRDRSLAQEQVLEELNTLVASRQLLVPLPRVGNVLSYYLKFRTPQKASVEQQSEDRRRAAMWRTRLGDDKRVDALGAGEWTAFIAQRASGAINAKGHPVPEGDRKAVGPRTVDADLVFLVSVLNWAMGYHVDGRALLKSNPWGGQIGVKRALARPVNPDPHRPLLTWDEFVLLRKAAHELRFRARKREAGAELVTVKVAALGRRANPTQGLVKHWVKPGYLHWILDLCEQTGRRLTAVARLMHSDLVWEGGRIVALRWRPHKRAKKTVRVPINAETRAVLEARLREHPGLGDTPIFPSPQDPTRPVSKRTCLDWLDRARLAANLGARSFGFHALRRKWATERKKHPRKDVMFVGGWEDERSLVTAYEQEDPDTVLAVIEEPRKLQRRRQG